MTNVNQAEQNSNSKTPVDEYLGRKYEERRLGGIGEATVWKRGYVAGNYHFVVTEIVFKYGKLRHDFPVGSFSAPLFRACVDMVISDGSDAEYLTAHAEAAVMMETGRQRGPILRTLSVMEPVRGGK